jgi:two-component system chemotaxis response regulator CheB
VSAELTRVAPKIVVIGASAGGLLPLQEVLGALPVPFPAVICVVVHIPAWRKSLLPSALSVNGHRAVEAMNRQELIPGQVYVAPADHHLLVDEGEAVLWHGPKENAHRPAVNALFRSAAVTYGPAAVGLVLSGALEDGATGLWWIKRHGGIAIVQDPKEAQFSSMPESALSTVEVDHCLPARRIAPVLLELTSGRGPTGAGEANA